MRGLPFEKLARDQIRLAVPPTHPFARLRAISVARLAGEPLMAQSLSCIISARLKLIPLSPAPTPAVVGAAWSRDRFTPAAQQFFRCAQGENAECLGCNALCLV